jgi:hypothetical protein
MEGGGGEREEEEGEEEEVTRCVLLMGEEAGLYRQYSKRGERRLVVQLAVA